MMRWRRLFLRAAALGALIALTASTVAVAQSDVTSPTDPVVIVNGVNDGDASAGAPPANEQPFRAFDNITQKYLNFLDLGSGISVTPGVGSTFVTGLRLYTANDAVERDPASYLLEGSNDGVLFTPISAGDLALPAGRNPGGLPPADIAIDPLVHFNQEVSFANATAYSSYRLTFPTLKDAALANSMQIAEVELLGRVIPEPSSIALVVGAAIGCGVMRRRRRA